MKLLVALLLGIAGSAFAGEVVVTIQGRVAPGIYGSVVIGEALPQPRFYHPQPIVVVPQPTAVVIQPLYLYVHPVHRQRWADNCWRYEACNRPVFFVHEDWVRERDRDWHHWNNPKSRNRGHRGHDHIGSDGRHGNGHDKKPHRRDRD